MANREAEGGDRNFLHLFNFRFYEQYKDSKETLFDCPVQRGTVVAELSGRRLVSKRGTNRK